MSKQPFNSLADQLKKAGLTSVDLAWFERIRHRGFAPTPPKLLRHLAKKAGFTSVKDFLDAEKKGHHAS